MKAVLAVYTFAVASIIGANAQPVPIDSAKSTLIIRVYKAGPFSVLGHDHEIAAPIASGSVDTTAHEVVLRIVASALQVRDPGISEKERAEIQNKMTGPEVLDAQPYREIVFESTEAEQAGPDKWNVRGNLTLHGEKHLIGVEVRQVNGYYVGSSRFKQSEFGIKPIRIAGGAVRVKDEVRVDFQIRVGTK